MYHISMVGTMAMMAVSSLINSDKGENILCWSEKLVLKVFVED